MILLVLRGYVMQERKSSLQGTPYEWRILVGEPCKIAFLLIINQNEYIMTIVISPSKRLLKPKPKRSGAQALNPIPG